MSNEWVQHSIWWQVYPLGFVGADTSGADTSGTSTDDAAVVHRLPALEPWLEHLTRLGANGLALGPVFASASHGYDTVDHFRVDPRLGDEADFVHLVEAAHARGVRVLLDGVFNHVGRGFAAVQNAEADPAAPENAWFRRDAAGGLETFEGHHALVALNHDEPAVAEHVVSVMDHWLALGADGWRLDAAYATSAAFWQRVLPRVREAHPDAFVFGEVLHGDYAAFVAASGVDSVTQYELWKAIWSSLDSGNFFELDWALQRHDGFLDAFVPVTFVGNHDVTRLASSIADARHRAHALVLLFTLGGTPVVYYGDETGLTGVKEERVGGGDAIRPAFPAAPPGTAGLTGAARETFTLHQRLIEMRRRHAWLHGARSRTIALSNLGYVYEMSDGTERLVVALNLGDEPLEAEGETVPAHGWLIVGE